MADITRIRRIEVSTHSRPKAAGTLISYPLRSLKFQLTAARRRLVAQLLALFIYADVSTHSRPKAAGYTHMDNQLKD